MVINTKLRANNTTIGNQSKGISNVPPKRSNGVPTRNPVLNSNSTIKKPATYDTKPPIKTQPKQTLGLDQLYDDVKPTGGAVNVNSVSDNICANKLETLNTSVKELRNLLAELQGNL